MKKGSVAVFVVIFFVCLSLCHAGSKNYESKQLEEDEEYNRRLTLSIAEARVAISNCPVCAAPKVEKRLFASLFASITGFMSRLYDGLWKLIWGEDDLYNVDNEVLPVFSNASVQLTTLSERLQQQAVALEENNKTLPEFVPWVYRSSAAIMQGLASYISTLKTEMSASATMEEDVLECYVSQVVYFLFQNTFPNMITLTETVLVAKDAWIPDAEADTSTTINSLANSRKSLQPGNELLCFADKDALDGAPLLPVDAKVNLDLCSQELVYILVLVIGLLGPLLVPLVVVLSVLTCLFTLFSYPLIIVVNAIRLILGFLYSLYLAITGQTVVMDPSTEGADSWVLLVEVLQASPLSSRLDLWQPRLDSRDLMCEIESLMCQLDALQENLIPQF